MWKKHVYVYGDYMWSQGINAKRNAEEKIHNRALYNYKAIYIPLIT